MRYNPGQIGLTHGVNSLVNGDHSLLKECMDEFLNGNWGTILPEDEANLETLACGIGSVTGIYEVLGKKVWVRSEVNGLNNANNATVIMRPSEY